MIRQPSVALEDLRAKIRADIKRKCDDTSVKDTAMEDEQGLLK